MKPIKLNKYFVMFVAFFAAAISFLTFIKDGGQVNKSHEVASIQAEKEDNGLITATLEEANLNLSSAAGKTSVMARPLSTDATNVQAAENDVAVPDLFARAIEGDFEAALEFVELSRQCRNIETLESQAEAMSALMARVASENGLEVPDSLKSSAWQKTTSEKVESCLQVLSHASDDHSGQAIGNRIQAQAEKGNALFRFMYAIWGPGDRAITVLANSVSEYEIRAREYTAINFSEEPSLALLALGISYSEGNLFTPLQMPLGKAYLWAAGLCGANMDLVQQLVDKYATTYSAKVDMGQARVSNETEISEAALQISDYWCGMDT
jgi:hypothetical protein